MRGLREFVPGGFPLPQSPIYDGMGDFVAGGFPLPQSPVWFPAVDGSLPKAPALTQSDLAPLPASDSEDCGGGIGCGCRSCGGVGAFDLSTMADMIPGTTFGIPNTYLAIGAVLALFAYSSMGGRRRR